MTSSVKLGGQQLDIQGIGYGAMVLEGYYGAAGDSDAVNTLGHALERGMMIDSADAYGEGRNESLIGEAVRRSAARPFIATKFGIVFDPSEQSREVPTGWGFSLQINATPGYAQRALDASLKRLGVESIDLWYAHYPDPEVPIEETVGAMAEAVKAGKVSYLGLSNVTAEEARRAHQVHPISAVQFEYSLWRREAESELLPTLRDLGISLVAWSPLGSGFLTGSVERLEKDDFRNFNPRYSEENLALNRDRFQPLMELAGQLNITPAQLALAWLLHQGDDIIPIPGTRRPARIDENLGSLGIALDRETLEAVDRIARPGTAQGATLL